MVSCIDLHKLRCRHLKCCFKWILSSSRLRYKFCQTKWELLVLSILIAKYSIEVTFIIWMIKKLLDYFLDQEFEYHLSYYHDSAKLENISLRQCFYYATARYSNLSRGVDPHICSFMGKQILLLKELTILILILLL